MKASGSLWQYYRDEPIINNDGNIVDFPDDPDTASFKYKLKKWSNGYEGTKDVQIMVLLKYLSNFWRTLEMPLTNC